MDPEDPNEYPTCAEFCDTDDLTEKFIKEMELEDEEDGE
jgi:hypothetical protein